MPDASEAYFVSLGVGAVVQLALSLAFLVVGVKYDDACCDEPLANWNIAAGAIGVVMALITFLTLGLSKLKADKYRPHVPVDAGRNSVGKQLTDSQKAEVRKLMADHERSKARKMMMYEGPIGRLFAFMQSCQSCYVVIMVIVGSAFVFSTFPNENCLDTQPLGCDPFLYYWSQAWVIIYFVLTGLALCLGCCAICALAGLAAGEARGPNAV
mmetsp:Transcript_78/g.240  ORF Transcript_78/g.240 Transcript_78/m.240 type:complete len:212 (+) Transcript_78:359-994(+)|eukprot:CAMPEP_0117648142 /NCGR_PEP_ID=MMETSP0804-20121206/232_1 /TAXON_ID=1074897 /ORGANISM="Tetraselmis astigmatica, Strain CCMP880" /LENGTH=211 /DNA_ID=CAMNT_0005453695 /DNA_START=266 /DNA_END=901 /DNA_ORIENTATION=-